MVSSCGTNILIQLGLRRVLHGIVDASFLLNLSDSQPIIEWQLLLVVMWAQHGVRIQLLLLLDLKLLLERIGANFLNKELVLRLSVNVSSISLSLAIECNLTDFHLFDFRWR